MSTQFSDMDPLPLELFSKYDDEQDLMYKPILQALVEGTTTPSKAASDIDAWVVNDSNNRLNELMKRPTPTLTSEEEEAGMHLREIMPNASGCIESVFLALAKLCSSFPPYHDGQDRIVQFLEALQAMPKHQVHDRVQSEDSNDSDHLITLWPLGDGKADLNWVFDREADEYSHPYSDVETIGSEARVRWRNYQSAIARITTLGLIDLGFLCALGFIIPSSRFYPDFKERKIGGPNRVGGDVIAGAQWILSPKECAYVYQQCKKVQKTDDISDMWSTERWNIWKEQFAFVAADERFDAKAQKEAKLAHERMLAVEEEDKKGK